MIVVPVGLGARSYDVTVGAGVRHELATVLRRALPEPPRRVAVITQDLGIEVDPGVEHRRVLIPRGEDAKNLATVEAVCRELAAWGMTRRDAVVAVGGGMVTDVGGFVASVYHRGLPVVHVSTTLLGQIDAAIGGKTGVNLPEGKNLVGTFWQPSAVLCDTELLATLPPGERRSGLGELAKYHFLLPPDSGLDLAALALDEQVAACVRIKAEVVAGDERERAIAADDAAPVRGREVLNYGHTLAHAIETAGDYGLRHGEAVAVGLVYAAELAHMLGRIDAARVAEHRRVVGGYDLPVRVPATLGTDELLELFGRDKKALDGITFVLDGPRGVEPVTGVEPEAMRAALERVR